MTTKDLIKFCIYNGVTVSFETDPSGIGRTGLIKVSDWKTNSHFARTVNLYELDRTGVDITDYIIDEASFKLRLNNGISDEELARESLSSYLKGWNIVCESED